MTREEAQAEARAWCDAWNRGDLDAVMSHYADDVAFNSPTVPQRWGIADGWLRGKERVRENFAIGIRKPGLRFELVDVLLGAPNILCILYRRETGALVTDLVETDEAGRGLRVVACYGEGKS